MARWSDKKDDSSLDNTTRYQSGWRSGKPVEDPDKMKRWGIVSAKPSEYLVCIKRGQIHKTRSGQGASTFKWPWETIAIVPTTLQKIEFVADQITRERVGVQITGIAVYRIAVPELAYRVLNFTYGERASEKLGQTLREMFIGAARRLIANLALDDCLTRRKEAIASFLMQEIAPVVSGRGAPGDNTDQGWGVVIDTIEIQDVKILSDKVFQDLQAPYRAEIATRSEVAELERLRQVAERRSETERRVAEAEMQASRETRALKARAEAETTEIEAAETLRAEQAKARITSDELERRQTLARKKLEAERDLNLREAETLANLNRRKAELEREKALAQIRSEEERRKAQALADLQALAAEAELEREKVLSQIRVEEERRKMVAQAELQALNAELELEQASAAREFQRLQLERERQNFKQETELHLQQTRIQLECGFRQLAADSKHYESRLEAEIERTRADTEILAHPSRVMQELVSEGLPQIAAALSHNLGSIHYTHLGGSSGTDQGPFGVVASAFSQVLAVARSFGLDLEGLGKTGTESEQKSAEA